MPISLSVKNVPAKVARALMARARRNHRSLQEELVVILREAVGQPRRRGTEEILKELRKAGLRTPSESLALLRQDRDACCRR
ncbi:MAG: hypothetical protein HYU77_01125 [Betaproteobacteria bacterium]|nr:hypothetical protein [Betaproteobacteria bacterium]